MKIIVHRILFAAVVIVVIWAAAAYIPTRDTGSDTLRTVAKEASFNIAVNTIGTLDAERSHIVSSTIKGDKGKIVHIIDEGTFVQKGDILIQFDTTHFEAEMLRLGGEIKSREATVEARKQILEWEKSQAEGAIKNAEFELQDAQQEYLRYVSYIRDLEDLSKKGLNYPNEIIQAKKKAEQLLAKQQKQETFVNQIKKESVFKIAAAMAELNRAQNEIETARLALEDVREEFRKSTVRAPFPGIVVHFETFRDNQKRKTRVGDTVWQNQRLLYLPDISSMIVKSLVREIDLHKIAKGQKATIQVDAYPKRSFDGQVTSIGVLASDSSEAGKGEKQFQVVVSLQGENSDLRPGMTARVTIHTGRAMDVLAVPVQAVFTEGAKNFCYVFKGNTATKVDVQIGRQNEDYVEIVGGLKNGDIVSLVRPAEDEKRQ